MRNYTKTTAARTITLAVVTLASACAHGTYGSEGRPRSTPADVVVVNHNWMDMVVYAERDGTRARLGMVRTGARARFRLPYHVTFGPGGLILVADPIGGDVAFRSQPISIDLGMRVTLTLENQLSLSAHWVDYAR